MKRRLFLKGSLAGIAALGWPRVRGAGSDALMRVAVLGHTGRGGFGHGLDVMWQRVPGTKVIAVSDPDPKGLQEAGARLPGAKGFSDYRTMLREIRPEIAAVGPRHVDQHHTMCLAALDAGVRGIYIEKPFCRTLGEAEDIIARCSSKKVKLAVAHRNRYHPVLSTVARLMADGAIGRIVEIRGRGKEDSRGGALDLWVLGSHCFNLASHLSGPALACTGMLYRGGKPCVPTDVQPGNEGIGSIAGDELHARFEMSDGTPFFFDSKKGPGDPAANFGLQFIGTDGVLDLRVDREPLAHLRKGNPHNPGTSSHPWQTVSSSGIGLPEPIADLAAKVATHQLAGEDLVRSILEDVRPKCDAVEGRATIEMILGVFESHRRGGARVAFPFAERGNPLDRPW